MKYVTERKVFHMPDLSILVIDDEIPVLKAVKSVLSREQMKVTCAQSSKEAFALLKEQRFDLILLDVIMPGQDGFSFLKEMREQELLTPVILLSGRDEDTSQVKGLGLGADDYMTKPFSKTVLVSKIRAIIRRTQQYTTSAPSIPATATCGSFTLRLGAQTVIRGEDEISLSAKEFSLLYYFVEHPETVLTKAELFTNVWKSDVTDDNTILVYIKRLRDKIEENPSKPQHLLTVWGKGYKFVP